MPERVLVVDVGTNIVGIQNARCGKYIPYYGEKRIRAIERLEKADNVVTYNGTRYDIAELNKLSATLRGKVFCMYGVHTDMQEVYWPGILGSNLDSTYRRYLSINREFSSTYEGSNHQDVYMTLMLWRYWKKNGDSIGLQHNNSLQVRRLTA